MAVQLRKRAPYTCRFEIAGKLCAAYLKDEDTNYCTPHQQAVDSFFKAKPLTIPVEADKPLVRRIWP